jgi:hypothetical protein
MDDYESNVQKAREAERKRQREREMYAKGASGSGSGGVDGSSRAGDADALRSSGVELMTVLDTRTQTAAPSNQGNSPSASSSSGTGRRNLDRLTVFPKGESSGEDDAASPADRGASPSTDTASTSGGGVLVERVTHSGAESV